MSTPVSLDELDRMAAEVLPEQTVLSAIVTPPGGGGAIDNGGGATMMSTCTTTTTYNEPGLIGLLGLGINNVPVTTTTCIPSAVVSS